MVMNMEIFAAILIVPLTVFSMVAAWKAGRETNGTVWWRRPSFLLMIGAEAVQMIVLYVFWFLTQMYFTPPLSSMKVHCVTAILLLPVVSVTAGVIIYRLFKELRETDKRREREVEEVMEHYQSLIRGGFLVLRSGSKK